MGSEANAAARGGARVPLGIGKRQLALPIGIFAASLLAYGCSVAAAVLAQDMIAKIGLAALSGAFIANLAIIGHDAVHHSFTRVSWLNRLIGTLAFLPALHPYGRWEHHHNRVHHRFTAQIGVDNAYSPMTVDAYRAASPWRRLHYRFMRSLAGQPFFYLLEIWLPKMFLPVPSEARGFSRRDWIELGLVQGWLAVFVAGLTAASWLQADGQRDLRDAFLNAALFGFLIPFLVWNAFISFVTIVQHTGPRARWSLPSGRPSTYAQKLRGTIHVVFPEPLDWFFHRVMQHVAHHVNPVIPLYALKAAERQVIAGSPEPPVVERWTPLYHWRLTRDCKLYDPARDGWCDFGGRPTAPLTPGS